ncbi:hypothetical protein [Halothiobacillus neapolitanus]|uniref:hypothetical protein n=1 Tax=Halothiobacillus neapolitanus TaxID=927 RepID=UPI00105EF2F1|nr:hypothetical protein [Halothiobacillus neapolitanus]
MNLETRIDALDVTPVSAPIDGHTRVCLNQTRILALGCGFFLIQDKASPKKDGVFLAPLDCLSYYCKRNFSAHCYRCPCPFVFASHGWKRFGAGGSVVSASTN